MEDNPIFIDTQGNIKYNTEKDFFPRNYMNIQWKNKQARKMLIYLIDKFNTPPILYLKDDGLALWNNNYLKNIIYKKKKILFNEILIRDIYDFKNTENKYPFLSVYYKLDMNNDLNKNINKINDYVHYDSFRKLLEIKSFTLEENLVCLHILLYNNISSTTDFLKMKTIILKN